MVSDSIFGGVEQNLNLMLGLVPSSIHSNFYSRGSLFTEHKITFYCSKNLFSLRFFLFSVLWTLNQIRRNNFCVFLEICIDGMFSETGLVPCQLCPRHMFTNESGAPIGGYLKCHSCPTGTYTARLGSNSANQCKLPCSPGHFSLSGLEPCSVCVFFWICAKIYFIWNDNETSHWKCIDFSYSSLLVIAGTSFFILNFYHFFIL